MKKNKLLYIITILMILLSFNLEVNANENENEKSDAAIMCIYDIGGNKINNKTLKTVILKQNTEKLFTLYTHESESDIAEPGWEIGIIDTITYNENDISFVFESCPKSIGISINTHTEYIGGTGYGAANQSQMTIVKTDKYTIKLDDSDATDGRYNLNQDEMDRNMAPNTNINIDPEQYWENMAPNPGGGYLQPEDDYKVSTLTSNTTCDNISEEILNSLYNSTTDLATCYYGYDINSEGCHLIAISHLKSGGIEVKGIDPSYIATTHYEGNSLDFSPFHEAVMNNDGWCLPKIWTNRTKTGQGGSLSYISAHSLNSNVYERYYRIFETGVNLVDQTKLQSENPDKNTQFGNLSIFKKFECATLLSDSSSKKLLDMIKFAINVVKIAIPILLIGLGILDFAKAIFQGKEDEMKKAQEKFMKRIIIGVCLFLVPTILKTILTIGNSIWGDVISADFCGIL